MEIHTYIFVVHASVYVSICDFITVSYLILLLLKAISKTAVEIRHG